MKQFIVLYFLFLSIAFMVFVVSPSAFSLAIHSVQTEFTLNILEYFLEENQRLGSDIWIHNNYKIVISDACNGIIPLLFLYASIWAYPSGILHKFIWMFWGYILLFVVNILRILLVVFVTQRGRGQEEFYWSHDIVGNILLMSMGLTVFVHFIKLRPKRLKSTKDS